MKCFIYSALALIFISCAPVKYYTYFDGGFDPTYEMKKITTIGFVPQYWSEAAKGRADELMEKRLFGLARTEFENRGFNLKYINPKYLTQDSTGNISVQGLDTLPDLTLTVIYNQGLGNVVNVPGQSFGSANWNKNGGGGYYGSNEGYQVQTFLLSIGFTLWNGKPDYMEKIWFGGTRKGSATPNLEEEMPTMVRDIFWEKFDRR